MNEIKKGDNVTRNSYNNDVIFCVKKIIKLPNNKKLAILKGIDIRIEADAYIDDLKLINGEEIKKYEKKLEERILNTTLNKNIEKRRKEIINTGKILHLDGDSCLDNKNSLLA